VAPTASLGLPAPYDRWSIPSSFPANIQLVDQGDLRGLRLRFTCVRKKGCPGVYTLTNTKMLELLIRALDRGWKELTLPEGLQKPAY